MCKNCTDEEMHDLELEVREALKNEIVRTTIATKEGEYAVAKHADIVKEYDSEEDVPEVGRVTAELTQLTLERDKRWVDTLIEVQKKYYPEDAVTVEVVTVELTEEEYEAAFGEEVEE